ncbi:hypothetical protein VUR80DRAFT_6659 [Thermomyces stellatus]
MYRGLFPVGGMALAPPSLPESSVALALARSTTHAGHLPSSSFCSSPAIDPSLLHLHPRFRRGPKSIKRVVTNQYHGLILWRVSPQRQRKRLRRPFHLRPHPRALQNGPRRAQRSRCERGLSHKHRVRLFRCRRRRTHDAHPRRHRTPTSPAHRTREQRCFGRYCPGSRLREGAGFTCPAYGPVREARQEVRRGAPELQEGPWQDGRVHAGLPPLLQGSCAGGVVLSFRHIPSSLF